MIGQYVIIERDNKEILILIHAEFNSASAFVNGAASFTKYLGADINKKAYTFRPTDIIKFSTFSAFTSEKNKNT